MGSWRYKRIKDVGKDEACESYHMSLKNKPKQNTNPRFQVAPQSCINCKWLEMDKWGGQYCARHFKAMPSDAILQYHCTSFSPKW